MTERLRLPYRRLSENFTFEVEGLRFTAAISRLADGRIVELFLNNHKSGNQSDTNARDAAIILSFALQHSADIDAIQRALCRDSQGRALGPIGVVLDLILNPQGGETAMTVAGLTFGTTPFATITRSPRITRLSPPPHCCKFSRQYRAMALRHRSVSAWRICRPRTHRP